ncbi:MAG: hypothetical protein KatS3mg007_1324 [Thermoanaerobaculum sp.]|nr:MAG: hypothetical protein KatS3mg007_1324 [Thermoanaerobaculum sp.]
MVYELGQLLEEHLRPLVSEQRGGARYSAWGWKEPRSIYLLPFWNELMPSLRFIHVIRDGRDMAFSANQNQLRKHGKCILGESLDN